MSQCPIAKLTMLEKMLIVRGLVESGSLIIIDAHNKNIWRDSEIVDVSKQGDTVQIVVR